LNFNISTFAACSSAHEFVDNKLGTLLGVMKAYSVLYASLNVPNRKILEKQWSRLYRVPEVREAVNNLLDFEVPVPIMCKHFFQFFSHFKFASS